MAEEQVLETVEENNVEELASELAQGEHQAAIESLIFAYAEPLSITRISEIMTLETAEIEQYITEITKRHANAESGFELVKIGEAYHFRTKPLFGGFIRELKATKPKKLSPAALETLAIIAYRQPIVRSDIEKIRGVDVSPTIKTLLERNLIKIAGHQSSVGQPALYATDEEFLKIFGLSSLQELPSLKDLKEFDREPGESQEINQ